MLETLNIHLEDLNDIDCETISGGKKGFFQKVIKGGGQLQGGVIGGIVHGTVGGLKGFTGNKSGRETNFTTGWKEGGKTGGDFSEWLVS